MMRAYVLARTDRRSLFSGATIVGLSGLLKSRAFRYSENGQDTHGNV